jgi:hypothetical protein
MENYFQNFLEKNQRLKEKKDTQDLKSHISLYFNDEYEYLAKEHIIEISDSAIDEKYFKFI